MIKRALDIAVSLVLLLLTLPLLLLSGLAIRMTSPGPMIFRQIRMGRGFRPFEIYKLRTMTYGSRGLAYTLGADARITRAGKFLRRWKLDELPQLWNVMRGDMSLVGPRPVVPVLAVEFASYYRRLLKVRPGLTDPASLKYSQEAQFLSTVPDPMRYFKTVVTPDKIAISTRYLERATVWSDLQLMAMTVLICFFPTVGEVYGAAGNSEPASKAGRALVAGMSAKKPADWTQSARLQPRRPTLRARFGSLLERTSSLEKFMPWIPRQSGFDTAQSPVREPGSGATAL